MEFGGCPLGLCELDEFWPACSQIVEDDSFVDQNAIQS